MSRIVEPLKFGFLPVELGFRSRIGQPEDLAKVIVSLLSDDFGWVTAQDIEVSGGHLL